MCFIGVLGENWSWRRGWPWGAAAVGANFLRKESIFLWGAAGRRCAPRRVLLDKLETRYIRRSDRRRRSRGAAASGAQLGQWGWFMVLFWECDPLWCSLGVYGLFLVSEGLSLVSEGVLW